MPEPGGFAGLLTMEGWALLLYEFGPPLVRALVVAIGTWIGARFAQSSFNFAARRADAHARLLIGRIINILIFGVGIATILDTLGVPLTTFVTVIGVAGLGVSLAMQDVLKSFVAGTLLLFERPFRIGDTISVKEQRGVVEDIGIRTTRLRNTDNVEIIIPNAVVFAEVVANRTNEVKPEPARSAAAVTVEPPDREGPRKDVTPSSGVGAATSANAATAAPTPPSTQ